MLGGTVDIWCAIFAPIYWTMVILEVCKQSTSSLSFGVQLNEELFL